MYESVRRRLRLRTTLPVVCVAGLALAISLSGCAVGGERCTLNGTASFNPGLNLTKRAISYSFTGNLSGCTSTLGDSTIRSGTVTASGSGAKVGCAGGGTNGTATVSWNNGQTSTVSFVTSGALNAVLVTGTITAGEFAGHTLHAVLAFTVANPSACNTPTGVTTATFTGETTPQ